MIKIWGRSTSLNVQKVLWCCVELGIEFHRIDWAGPFGGNETWEVDDQSACLRLTSR